MVVDKIWPKRQLTYCLSQYHQLMI